MGRLILHMQTSIDGCVDSHVPGSTWNLWDWGPDWPWSPDLRKRFNDLLDSVSGIVLSRPMVSEGYLAHWQRTADQHPGDPDHRFAHRIGELPKFVITEHGTASTWPNTTVVTGPLAESTRQAKAAATGDLVCFGGAGFARALLRHDLVDDLLLAVNPGVAGDGPRIFDASMAHDSYELAEAFPSACGILLVHWAKRRR
ncbi:dihydrofolate reductase family protein [Sphaerisporangium sp. NPDC004334]